MPDVAGGCPEPVPGNHRGVDCLQGLLLLSDHGLVELLQLKKVEKRGLSKGGGEKKKKCTTEQKGCAIVIAICGLMFGDLNGCCYL